MRKPCAGGPVASYLRAIHPDDRERIAHIIGDTVANGRHFDEEYRVVQPDGSARWVVARGDVVRDEAGHPVTLSGAAVDITDRKATEMQLRTSEERYQSLYNSIDAGFFAAKLIDDDRGVAVNYRFLAVNPAFEKQTKWSNVVGRTVREFAPDLESYWFEMFDTIAKTGQSIHFENSVEALEQRHFDVYGYRVGGPEQRTVAILFNDITPRKLADQEREHLVAELRDADRRKDEFLAMLAHELRNPLGVISNGVQLVQTVREPELLAELRDMMQRQVTHLTHLIDDLLDVSRITQGKIELRKQTLMLSDVMRRAAESVKSLVSEKHHEMAVSMPDEPIRFVADPTRTEQILDNLLTNAAKYSEPYGSIHFSAIVEGGQIAFRVKDAGDGISAEMLPKVFGLFTQIDPTIDRSRGGLGIGLTLVRSLVEMHGGKVTAASEGRGKGSEFTVHMPIGLPMTEPADTAAVAADSMTGTGRILIVDDNRDTVGITSLLLRHAGFQVETAYDGPAAIEAARRFRPDVILLDIGLPGLNGYDVASTLRDDGCCRSALMIALSGYGDDKARQRAKAAGFDRHLVKPVDFDQLISIIIYVNEMT